MRCLKRILVTGGAGFIGSAFIRYLFQCPDCPERIVNVDALTYAADQSLLDSVSSHPQYRFARGDINDQSFIEALIQEEKIDAIVHFAAETHVDRSIVSAMPFVESNVKGTVSLLECVKKFPHIHFHHVSTDEVYGALGESGVFSELSPYRPNSPYAASKAASDHFVQAYANTYRLSTTISHCSNNYGPGQHVEKFIPLTISHVLNKKNIPVYGSGNNVRDWLYVDDHADGIWKIMKHSAPHQTYDMGGLSERTNLELVHHLLQIIAQETEQNVHELESLIQFVPDRPGHDFRYAIDISKIWRDLGWKPRTAIEDGLRKTVRWYTQRT